MSNLSANNWRMKNKRRVILEPALEEVAGNLSAHERVMLAKKYYRWAIQLFVSARVMRQNTQLLPKRIQRIPRRRLALN